MLPATGRKDAQSPGFPAMYRSSCFGPWVFPVYPENYSAVALPSARRNSRGEQRGFSDDLCSYSRVNLGIILGKGIDDPDFFRHSTP
jgi:hypothetical protein